MRIQHNNFRFSAVYGPFRQLPTPQEIELHQHHPGSNDAVWVTTIQKTDTFEPSRGRETYYWIVNGEVHTRQANEAKQKLRSRFPSIQRQGEEKLEALIELQEAPNLRPPSP